MNCQMKLKKKFKNLVLSFDARLILDSKKGSHEIEAVYRNCKRLFEPIAANPCNDEHCISRLNRETT